MLTGLNHLTLAVHDLPRSVSFYRDLLGFRLAAQWDAGAYLALGELWLCLTHDASDRPIATGAYTHYAFSIASDAFAAFCACLREAGVPEWQPNRSEGGSFYFLDPDGHQLEAHAGTLATRIAECRLNPYKGMVFSIKRAGHSIERSAVPPGICGSSRVLEKCTLVAHQHSCDISKKKLRH